MSIFKDLAEKVLRSSNKDGPGLEAIEDIQDQTAEEKELASYVKDKVDQCRQNSARIAIEAIYLTNVAYLMGFTQVFYDTQARTFKNADPKRKVNRNSFKVNKILPNIQNRLSRLTQSPPRYDVRPNSNSSDDKDCARLGVQIIEDMFDKWRFTEKRQDILMSAMQGGHSYARIVWDPSLGNPLPDMEKSGEFQGYEGDLRLDVYNCLEVFPDPLAKNLDEAAWVCIAKVRKLDYFKARYPERGSAVKAEDAWLLSSVYDLKSNSLTANGVAGSNTQEQMKNASIEIVYMERRSKDHPNGRLIIAASGILLEDKELPIGELDIVKFDDIMIGGRYNAEAVITHLRPIQDQYNITRTRMADYVRSLLGGKFLVAKGSGLQQEALNNNSGSEVVEYNPVPNAPPPQAMQMPSMPAYAYKEVESLDGEFNEVSGINEISKGVLPSAGMPAAGMAFLQEQDQTRIGVQTSRNEIGYARMGKIILMYVQEYYKTPRLLKLAGEGLGYTVKSFQGADLKSNFDAIVIEGSTIPSSKVLRRQDIMNALNAGILGDPKDPKLRAKLLKEMEFGDVAEVWKDQALNDQQVKEAIKMIEAGKIPVLSEFDDHAYHLTEMNQYRKGDKYKLLDQKRQSIFMYVFEWHIQSLTNLQNPGLQQQQIMTQLMARNMNQLTQGGADPMQPMPQAPLPAGPPGAPGPGGPPHGPGFGGQPAPGLPLPPQGLPADPTGAPQSAPQAMQPIPNAHPPIR